MGNLKAPFLIGVGKGATPFPGLLHLLLIHNLCWVFSKETLSTIFWDLYITWFGIEPWSPGSLVNTLTIITMGLSVCVFIYKNEMSSLDNLLSVNVDFFFFCSHKLFDDNFQFSQSLRKNISWMMVIQFDHTITKWLSTMIVCHNLTFL